MAMRIKLNYLPMQTSQITKNRLLRFFLPILLPTLLLTLVTSSCISQNLEAGYHDVRLQTVQLVDSKGIAVGGKARYVKLTLESKQDLTELSKGLLQFRAYVVLPNGERFLALGAGATEEKPRYFAPYNRKNNELSIKSPRTYSVFFFRDLIHDYDGVYKINLQKDNYSKIEFDVSYRIFAGPQLAASKTFSFSQTEFLKLLETAKNDNEPVLLVME